MQTGSVSGGLGRGGAGWRGGQAADGVRPGGRHLHPPHTDQMGRDQRPAKSWSEAAVTGCPAPANTEGPVPGETAQQPLVKPSAVMTSHPHSQVPSQQSENFGSHKANVSSSFILFHQKRTQMAFHRQGPHDGILLGHKQQPALLHATARRGLQRAG